MNRNIYEVIVCSLEDAIAAEQGGANRLEIISRYEVGGLTPSFDLVREVIENVNIPARVMLREEEGFRVTEEKKRERLCEVARSFRQLPIDGVVLGFLKAGRLNQIDHGLVARVLACVPELKATFHRAFEELADHFKGIEELKRHPQIDCILTGGGGEPWGEKLARFESWESAAQPEIGMLVGGGTDREAIRLFCEFTGIRSFHVGRAVRDGELVDGPVRARLVRELAELMGERRTSRSG